jgi:hypothetical protein
MIEIDIHGKTCIGCIRKIEHNVLHIPEGGDYEAVNFQLTMNKHRIADFHFSTNPLFWVYAVIASASY